MAVQYTKTSDGKLQVTDTKVVEVKHDLKQLRKQKQFFKSKIDEIQVLIDQAVLLGADEGE
jgi:hypothetical protein